MTALPVPAADVPTRIDVTYHYVADELSHSWDVRLEPYHTILGAVVYIDGQWVSRARGRPSIRPETVIRESAGDIATASLDDAVTATVDRWMQSVHPTMVGWLYSPALAGALAGIEYSLQGELWAQLHHWIGSTHDLESLQVVRWIRDSTPKTEAEKRDLLERWLDRLSAARGVTRAVVEEVENARYFAPGSMAIQQTLMPLNGLDWSGDVAAPPSRSQPTPIGIAEIAERLGKDRNLIDQWRHRYDDFPEPRWTVGGRPAWDWGLDILPWLLATRRLP